MGEHFQIVIKGVSKSFGDLAAIELMDLSVVKGEFIALIGPSGCGKSTALRMLADLEAPTTGIVTIDGSSPSDLRRKRKIGMVFQDANLLSWRTVAENIALPLKVAGRDRGSDVRSVDDLLRLVGLEAFRNAYPWQLSGGMRQRVAIARALVLNPSILLLDEPFGALDEITRRRLNIDLLKIWSEVGITAVLVTHSISEAVLMSDRVVVMTPRPGSITEIVDVNLPRPRNAAMQSAPNFFELERRASAALYREME